MKIALSALAVVFALAVRSGAAPLDGEKHTRESKKSRAAAKDAKQPKLAPAAKDLALPKGPLDAEGRHARAQRLKAGESREEPRVGDAEWKKALRDLEKMRAEKAAPKF